jgi:hypothetical protein
MYCSSANVLWRTPLFRLSRHNFLSDGGSARTLSLNVVCIFEIASMKFQAVSNYQKACLWGLFIYIHSKPRSNGDSVP